MGLTISLFTVFIVLAVLFIAGFVGVIVLSMVAEQWVKQWWKKIRGRGAKR